MANEVTVTTTDVRPLNDYRCTPSLVKHWRWRCRLRVQVTAATSVVNADGSAVATANVMGIAVAGALANTTIASEVLDVVTSGPSYWLRQHDQRQYDLDQRHLRPAVYGGGTKSA